MSDKLARLDANLAELEQMRSADLTSRREQWALRYGLLESIQIVIDLACELAASRNVGSPSTYRECVEILRDAGFIDVDLASSLAGMVGLRNLLVHEYDDIDPARLVPVLSRLDDIRAFARAYLRLTS